MSLFTELKACLSIAAKCDVRYYLKSVRLTNKGIIASDGYMGIIVEREIDIPEGEYLLCRFDLAKKIKMFTKKDDIVFTKDGDDILMNGIKIDLIDGRYPNMQRVIDTNFTNLSAFPNVGINFNYLSIISKAIATALDIKPAFVSGEMKIHDNGVSLEKDNVKSFLMKARL